MNTNNHARTVSLAMASLLVITYAATPHDVAMSLGLTGSSSAVTRLAYQMMHDNAIHLAINLYCLLSLTFLCGARLRHMAASLVIAMLVPAVILSAKPTVGLSVFNFALTGITISKSSKSFALLMFNIVLLLISQLMVDVATHAHIYAILSGFVYGNLTTPKYE